MVTVAFGIVERPAPGHYRERLGSLLQRTRLAAVPAVAPPAPEPPLPPRRVRRQRGAQLTLQLDDVCAGALRGRR